MSAGRFLASGLVTAMLAVLVAALSGVPYDPGGDAASAVLRLSWRTRAAAVRECREPTREELARLPTHMRRDRICDWRVPTHRLRVAVDGRVLDDARVEAAGTRGDRPLYVHRELPLEPGRHELEVRFLPEAGEGKRLTLQEQVELSAGDVALVTYDPDAGRLVLRRPGER